MRVPNMVVIQCTNDLVCEREHTVEVEFLPAEMYGTDADGNRGVKMPGEWVLIGDIPLTCPSCGHTYTTEELANMAKDANEYLNMR